MPGRPPRARHTTPMISLDRLACHAYGAHARRSPRTATRATEVQHEDNRNALDGKVLQRTPVLAMAQAQRTIAPASAKQQLQEHCDQRRKCLTCGRLRPIKDLRCRRLDTVLGTVRLRIPRYRYCKCGCDTQVFNPISDILSGRVTPELRHLQVSLGAQLSYRKAADVLRMLLPPVGGTTHTTTRARLIAVGRAHRRRDSTGDRRKSKTR